MRFLGVLFASLLCAAAAAPARAASGDREAALNRMDRSAAAFRSMSADIRRGSHTAVINEDTVDSGTMLLKRAKPRDMRMLVTLTHPDPKSVALQGKKLEIYYPKIKTVQEFDVGKNRNLLDQFFLVGFGTPRRELESAYTIKATGSETVAGQKTTRLELVPKSKEVLDHLKKFEMWISDEDGHPVQQKFYMAAGDYMLVTYTNYKANPDLPDSALKLQLPKGVKREYPQK
jgi:outer membrane lipoprotein-sorting protein